LTVTPGVEADVTVSDGKKPWRCDLARPF